MKLIYTFFASQNRFKISISGYAAILLLSSYLGFAQTPVIRNPYSSWDISKSRLSHLSYDYGGTANQVSGLEFNPTGTKMFLLETTCHCIIEYNLSVPFGIHTANYAGEYEQLYLETFSGSTIEENQFKDFSFDNTGYKLFVLGGSNDWIYQYTLSSPFDVSTATYDGNSERFSFGETSGPSAFEFNDTGSKLFVLEGAGDRVYQYVLTTNFDISSAIDPGFGSFYVGDQDLNPRSLSFSKHGNKMYIAGESTDKLYEYALATNFDPSSASLTTYISIPETLPKDVWFHSNGNSFYLIGNSGDTIVVNFNLSELVAVNENTTDAVFDVNAKDGNGGAVDSSVQYTLAGLDGEWFAIDSNGNITFTDAPDFEQPLDITGLDNVYEIEVRAFSNNQIAKQLIHVQVDNYRDTPVFLGGFEGFNVSLAQYSGSGESLYVGSEDLYPTGMVFSSNGYKLFVVGDYSNRVRSYTLKEPFDVSSAVSDGISSGSLYLGTYAGEYQPQSIFIDPTGQRLFVVGLSRKEVKEIVLATPFDLSSATLGVGSSFDVSANATHPTGLQFSPDGTSMYVLSPSTGIIQYNMNTAWDISTAYIFSTLSVAAVEPTAFEFSTDRKKIYVIEGNNPSTNNILTYQLEHAAHPIELAVRTNEETFSVSAQEGKPQAMAFNPLGDRMYILGQNEDTILEYKLTSKIEMLEGVPLVTNIDAFNGIDGATDASVTYELIGIDAGDFTIDTTGNLNFNSIPDFNNPEDANSNNLYELSLKITNHLGAAAWQNFQIKILEGTSLSIDPPKFKQLTVYPNPASSTLFLESQTPITSVTLYDVAGKQVVERKNLKHTNLTLDISTLTQGVYFVTIKTQKQKHSKKVIIN